MASIGTLVVGLTANTGSLQRGLATASRVIAGFAAGASAGAVGLVALAGKAEQTAVAMEVLLGSATAAQNVIGTMRQMAIESPFNSQQLIDATKMMIQFGGEAETSMQIINALSKVAVGDAQKLDALTLAFAQSSAAGRLMGQDLLQMVNAGFNPLLYISQRTGESMLDLKKRMEAGQVSFAEVQSILMDVTTGTGRFADMNSRMSKTVIGQWQRFTETLTNFGRTIGEAILPTATKFLELINSFGPQMTTFGAITTAVVSNIGTTFKTMWETVRDWGFATFEYLITAGATMAENIAIAITNVFASIRVEMQQLGEEIAYLLGWSDEVLQIKKAGSQPFVQMPEFKLPKLGEAGQKLADAIAKSLESTMGVASRSFAPTGGGMMGEDDFSAKQDRKFAEAMQKGSVEAYSAIVNAMRGGKDPNVAATEKQTKELINGLRPPKLQPIGIVESIL